MPSDVVDLRDFYRTGLGQVARRMIRSAIRRVWPDLRGMRLLGIGYPTPFLPAISAETERTVAVMPASLGVLGWSPEGRNLVTLADEGELPFADYSIDRVLLVHALETTEQVGPMLKEIWRVLAGGGRLLVVAPNRRGIWARLDRTPFGSGQPLHDVAIISAAARRAIHAGRIGHRAVHPAGAQAHDLALGRGMGADRQALVSDLRRGRAGRGDKADLCQADTRARPAPPPRLCAGAARAVAAPSLTRLPPFASRDRGRGQSPIIAVWVTRPMPSRQ